MRLFVFEMNNPIDPYEPPNGAKQEEIERFYPSTAPPGGEERFEDTGDTMKDFQISSRQTAKILKSV